MPDFDKSEKLEQITFYLLDKAIKSVNRYTIKQFADHDLGITKDQWLILKKISDAEGVNQKEVAKTLFKDNASMTRTIELLEKKGLICKELGKTDKREFKLFLTKKGNLAVEKAINVVLGIREKALEGLNFDEIEVLRNCLYKISQNTSPDEST